MNKYLKAKLKVKTGRLTQYDLDTFLKWCEDKAYHLGKGERSIYLALVNDWASSDPEAATEEKGWDFIGHLENDRDVEEKLA